jgi:fructose-bisphosphate aldolase, class I
MGLGKSIRLNRIFGHPSGRLCSVAVDHFLGYHTGMHPGLANLPKTLAAIVAGRPDAVTMNKGVALGCWGAHAGKVPLILQSITARPDDTADEFIAVPEDAVRMGADAFATCSFVRGATEAAHIRRVADFVRQAEAWDMPVIVHTYPRKFGTNGVDISFEPEDIAWAVRCAIEVGVDVVKVPYCGDVESYKQIVASCPVPVVAAGGPKAKTLGQALAMATEVIRSGARGMTIGRNIWGDPEITKALLAFKAVIHDGAGVEEAQERAGLTKGPAAPRK